MGDNRSKGPPMGTVGSHGSPGEAEPAGPGLSAIDGFRIARKLSDGGAQGTAAPGSGRPAYGTR